MNEENTLRLCKEFPKFLHRPESPKDSALWFGFECGDGWYNLLYDMCTEVMKACKDCDIPVGPDDEFDGLYATQIKEKYGTLRVYTSTHWDPIDDIIEKAERISAKTCERCGAEARFRDGCWKYTMCDRCWENRPKR